MKRLKQIPMIIPYRNGNVTIGKKEFTIKNGTQGRTMLMEFLVEDQYVSEKIKASTALTSLRELVLSQTIITNDPATKKRIIPNSSNFFGGGVFSFDKTEEGFYLIVLRNMDGGNDGKCFPSDKIGGVIIPDMDSITEPGKQLLEQEGLLTDEPVENESKLIKEEELVEQIDPNKISQAINKSNELVNQKLQNRERRVSKPV